MLVQILKVASHYSLNRSIVVDANAAEVGLGRAGGLTVSVAAKALSFLPLF